jgi:hypothetical protein
MQIFATFEHSVQIELAITNLEKMGISDIYAVPLDNGPEDIKLFDTIHRSDGTSLSNTGLVLAVFCSVIMACRGFMLEWGPIFWGIIGAVFGFIFGFIINLFFYKVRKKKRKWVKGKNSEVIMIIDCKEDEASKVERVLWEHLALGVAKVN